MNRSSWIKFRNILFIILAFLAGILFAKLIFSIFLVPR
ncbi:hypothetical protein IGL62_002908 [Enterococcus sp. AZ137]